MKPAVTWRPAGPGDVAFLTRVFLAAMREPIAATRGAWDEDRERRQFLGRLDLASTRVIRRGGRDAGFVMTARRGAYVELHTLCVLPAFQGRGIGSLVTGQVIREARDAGREVVLSVLRANPRARALYERLGFAVATEWPQHLRMRHAGPGAGPRHRRGGEP